MKMLVAHRKCFTLILTVLLTPFVFVGCGEIEEDLPETATVKVEILSSPNPLTVVESVVEPVVENNPNGPTCNAGDILYPGQICFYPGTDIKMSVLDDGTFRILNMFLGAGIHLERTSINGIPITLIAQRRHNNSWKIEKIGDTGDTEDPGTLDIIVSTDFTHASFDASSGEPIYNTKREFALTQGFSQNFRLDPDNPELAFEITNNTSHNLSVHYTVLFDGEVEKDGRGLLQSGSSWSWARSITKGFY